MSEGGEPLKEMHMDYLANLKNIVNPVYAYLNG